MNEKDKKEKAEEMDEVLNENTETAEAENQEEAPQEEAAEEETEKDPLAEANKKLEELNDKYLRKCADFENLRKRCIKDKSELILNGGEKTIKSILPVLDDFERAIENGKKTDDVSALREGVDLIYKKFIKVLEGEGVKQIETIGKDFDVDYHEAIAMVPGVEDDKKGKVIDCVQTGYTLNDKVIRYAKVAVGQ